MADSLQSGQCQVREYACHSVQVTDMHTGGEPLRVIERVSPDPGLAGDSLLAKRRDLRDRCDWLRRFAVFEPRGHADMYAALLLRPACHREADFSVLFLHNEGYSTMCGHAVIALAKYAVVRGLVAATPPLTAVNIECPCGLVRAAYHHGDANGEDSSSFVSVPAFHVGTHRDFEFAPAENSDNDEAATAAAWKLAFDIAYGGAFYIILPDRELRLDARKDPVELVVRRCQQLKRCVSEHAVGRSLTHPESPDLAFLYGVILTDGGDGLRESANLCVFADGEVDRSPTGSGVTARMATQHAKGLLPPAVAGRGTNNTDNGWRLFRNSKTGSAMRARLSEMSCPAGYPVPGAVRVEVAGRAHFTGAGTLTAEPDDPMLPGFRVK